MARSPSTAIVWFRRDLRVHDHPALARAVSNYDRVVPVFVFDDALLGGRFRSANRTQYLLDCLTALDGELRDRGGRLVVREGDPARELPRLVRETGASCVFATEETTGFARGRDERVAAALGDDVQLLHEPGTYIADLGALRTGQGKPYTVFTPFVRAWRKQERRPVVRAPGELALPSKLRIGRLPSLERLGFGGTPPSLEDRPEPGEAAAQRLARAWVRSGIEHYHERRDLLAEQTSRMSAYLRFGCLSARWLEERVLGAGDGEGPETYRSELAWRDFYGAVQLHFPETRRLEFRERYRDLSWADDDASLEAWKAGRTGYPVVDAAMRQLAACGWMHNRARMIVGSFLTKDLHLDWRLGEAHFMHHLIDGDLGSNNGGWQWVASTGTDPAPYFQRLFNPMTQQKKFDPDGAYVRRWVPELAGVPDDRLAVPWEMDAGEQEAAGCVIGEDYPAPIVDHAAERRRAIERYRAVG